MEHTKPHVGSALHHNIFLIKKIYWKLSWTQRCFWINEFLTHSYRNLWKVILIRYEGERWQLFVVWWSFTGNLLQFYGVHFCNSSKYFHFKNIWVFSKQRVKLQYTIIKLWNKIVITFSTIFVCNFSKRALSNRNEASNTFKGILQDISKHSSYHSEFQ